MENQNTSKVNINLAEVEIKDLNEVVYKVDDLHKQIGNIIFTKASTIEVSDLARLLHAGEAAEVTQLELEEIIVIVATNSYYKPFAQKQIVQYLNNKLQELKNLQEETTNV